MGYKYILVVFDTIGKEGATVVPIENQDSEQLYRLDDRDIFRRSELRLPMHIFRNPHTGVVSVPEQGVALTSDDRLATGEDAQKLNVPIAVTYYPK